MEALELRPGVWLMVFCDYWSMRKAKEHCEKRRRPVLYGWERGQAKEYQIKHWVLRIVPGRWRNYQESYSKNPCLTAKESLESAIKVLEEKTGIDYTHILVARSF